MSHPNHLGALRKRWKLHDQELAHLLGYRSKGTVCRAEKDHRPPTLKFALGCEIVFGVAARELFPAFYAQIEDAVMRRTVKLDEKLRDDHSAEATIKKALLKAMVQKAGKRTRA